MTTPSATPRTDAAVFHCRPSPEEEIQAVVEADFARTLETELTAARADAERLAVALELLIHSCTPRATTSGVRMPDKEDVEQARVALAAHAAGTPREPRDAMSLPEKSELDRLIDAASDAAFDCGVWDGGDPEEYLILSRKLAAAKKRLKDRLSEITNTP